MAHLNVEMAYKRPIAKTEDTPIFLAVLSLRDQMTFCGRAKMKSPETMLMAAVAVSRAFRLMQCPLRVWFQIFWCGMHDKLPAMRPPV